MHEFTSCAATQFNLNSQSEFNTNMAYSKKLLDHYENPQNVGSFAKDESGIGTGLVGAPACGDVM